jgi:type II secretory ATPase GspE/PulE/Tfp pilus assembly ATPase PilB-like protein
MGVHAKLDIHANIDIHAKRYPYKGRIRIKMAPT